MSVKVVVQDDGAYLVDGNGNLTPIGGIARVTAAGGLVVRYPARDVSVVTPLALGRHLDCSDIQLAIIAVVFGGYGLAAVAAIKPGIAALVQNFMTNNSLTAGAVD